MRTRFGFVDPGAIMGIIVALIVLAVGTYAVFVSLQQFRNMNPSPAPSATTTTTQNASWTEWDSRINNSSNTGTQIFNIVGIVLIIGSIMAIVGLVYNYVR